MQSVTLSVKSVPRDLARRLKARAMRHHRSLQGELLAILTEAGASMTVADLATLVDRMALRTPSEAARFIRADRDGHRR
jgi:plasmid stability protein